MTFSVQQIKFELLSAIKEFGYDGSPWRIAISGEPPAETLAAAGVEPDDYVFVGKPAASARAALIVREFMVGRCGVTGEQLRPLRPEECWVVMYRERAGLPQEAVPLQSMPG